MSSGVGAGVGVSAIPRTEAGSWVFTKFGTAVATICAVGVGVVSVGLFTPGVATEVSEQAEIATKLKPRWDLHLIGDDDQLACAGESLSSVLGE